MSGPGVSVVICTHNGGARLPAVLAHLAAQRAECEWEVVLVDNASTDGTAEIAAQHWPPHCAPLRIVAEPRLGLSFARRRGLDAAAYPIVGFVDDDNWLAPDWVAIASQRMAELPDVGALGGYIEPATDVPLPEWFARYQQCYAIGPQADAAGPIGWERGYVWGAGLIVRRNGLRELFAAGFEPQLSGRSGAGLSAGDDGELCLALMLAGWKLWYEPRLRLKHYLPVHRLEWRYLKRMWAGFGRASVVLDIYRHVPGRTRLLRQKIQQTWVWHAYTALKEAMRDHPPRKWRAQPPYSWDEVLHAYKWARFRELLRLNFRYDVALYRMRRAAWTHPRARAA